MTGGSKSLRFGARVDSAGMIRRVCDCQNVGGLGIVFETEQQHEWGGGVEVFVEFFEIFNHLSMLPAEVLLRAIEAGEMHPTFVAAKMTGSHGEKKNWTGKLQREREE